MFTATFATGAGGCRGPLALQTTHWEVQMGLMGLFTGPGPDEACESSSPPPVHPVLFTAHFADEKTGVQRDEVACSVSYS